MNTLLASAPQLARLSPGVWACLAALALLAARALIIHLLSGR